MKPKRINWSELNDWQQRYMCIIYQTDRLQERNAKGLMSMYQHSIPTDQ